MNKSKHFKQLVVVVAVMISSIWNVYGQSSCATSNNLTINSEVVTLTQTPNSSEHWVSFNALNDSVFLECIDDNYGIQQIDVYEGSCSSLTLVASSSNDYIGLTGLMVDSSYFVRFTSSQTSGNFKLLLAISFPTLHIKRNGTLLIPGVLNDICIGDQLEVWATWGSSSNQPTNYWFMFGGNGINDWFSLPMSTNANSSQHTTFTVNSIWWSNRLGQLLLKFNCFNLFTNLVLFV